MPGPRRIRNAALAKLALLSSTSAADLEPSPDFVKLCEACPPIDSSDHGLTNGNLIDAAAVGRVPMRLSEFEILLALCKAAPLVHNNQDAARLLHHISPYLSECCFQAISSSTMLRFIVPSPWEVLTSALTNALLQLGFRHPRLRERALAAIFSYITNSTDLARHYAASRAGSEEMGNEDSGLLDPHGIVRLSTSILGFLKAASQNARFWTSLGRYDVIVAFQAMLSEDFLLASESAFSVIRNAHHSNHMADWKQYLKQYAAMGQPLNALLLRQGFMNFVMACAVLLVLPQSHKYEPGQDVLQSIMLLDVHDRDDLRDGDTEMAERIADIAAQELTNLEENSDYLQLGSAWQQKLANSLKASSLASFLLCTIVNDKAAEPEVMMQWLEESLLDPSQIVDETLACTVLRCMAIMAKYSPAIASNLSRTLPRFLTRGPLIQPIALVAAECLLFVMKLLPQETVITTLYSLGNSLSVDKESDASEFYPPLNETGADTDQAFDSNLSRAGSAVYLGSEYAEGASSIYGTVILTIVTIVKGFNDEKITALALSMLVQKVGKISMSVDSRIIMQAAIIAANGGAADFRALLRLYARLSHENSIQNNDVLPAAIADAREHLSRALTPGSTLYEIYLQHLLETIISKGDVQGSQKERRTDSELAAREIAQLLGPLALLLSNNASHRAADEGERFPTLQRDAWYNIVVHGFSMHSKLGKQHRKELQILAKYSTPLILDDRVDGMESDVDLNTVLRRGTSSQSTSEQRKDLAQILPRCEGEIRSLSYPELILLKAAHLVETLRASMGECSRLLTYFVDPQLKDTPLGHCMAAIAIDSIDVYVSNTLDGHKEFFSAPYAAQQLSLVFAACCHHVKQVQQVAYACADRIISQVPSALCQKSSLFTLLDLLTVMWISCLESDTDEYEWNPKYVLPKSTITVHLSDDYTFRRTTLRTIHSRAKAWVIRAINFAPLDVKGLLQTYLSDLVVDDTIGHLSLGRSFALEMGSSIPSTDQRLGAIEVERELQINTASDFMAQYTMRQQYRFTSSLQPETDQSFAQSRMNGHLPIVHMSPYEHNVTSTVRALAAIESQLLEKESIDINQIRDSMNQAASLLCRSSVDQCDILTHFVKIPFVNFTKQSVKLGLSLWMGVIKENPRMESRLLVEIMEGWINTVRRKIGIFSPRLSHDDPFLLKEEFAPSDKASMHRHQQRIHDLSVPHFRVFQFLSSHYSATRLSSPTLEKAYHRLLRVTFRGLRATGCHPLMRELHFHTILLGLKVLRYSTTLGPAAYWRFKDDLLTAALAWFAHAPRWSYGGNRVQLKAEVHLLGDVVNNLQNNPQARQASRLGSLAKKDDLLRLLIENEITRLNVWLYPLEQTHKHHFIPGHQSTSTDDSLIVPLLSTAWRTDPAIAIHAVARYQSNVVTGQVRRLLLESPDRAIHCSDALAILLGPTLPTDVVSQLKYLLYWAPVSPITAVTYFLPAYRYHPCIIQYAVRALESHSVDVTFFYVPQIVQTLRYDTLGYVERYIVETGRFSQLFAHQIMWNMQANAFKDEDSEIPDPVKPTLDKVTQGLIASFSGEDKDFYEREFTFFNEITGISGKLRPFIKKSKPEKKAKIEEELRKIQVDVGVYLPSNPDGVVVGIDRKSGKPLQSHAKAPYMATFRIRRDRTGGEIEDTEEQIEEVNRTGAVRRQNTYEVWQSAIFKVGDDCRQDVLALQMIASFRGIFHHVGLPVYVFPYRVTATAPGCGVIDVLPNSISRDMIGREAVNGLYDWFRSKFGSEDSSTFQLARANFVKSLAAYSVISYLLQFKDRHNGNIMYDDEGHILHIDFGFCFDIAPGGVKFERAPFKLAKEMVAVLGGSTETQSFRWFEELTVKAFLASRPYVDTLANIVMCMLDSGLPCFKPETIQHFRERFVLEKSERDAAEFMRGLIKTSYNSYSTKGYDQFQLLTNGIPY